ncbi:MAG TPA: hypothetical protein VGY76_03365 [Solirubrobacteraceae bacterium]|jgi:hypothetical protein|nr:hypothetical protein [Solirubrobacteraceae bacterium]
MGRRKPRSIKIREDRLSKLDETKMEVAIWLLAKGKVEDRTQRSQPTPPTSDEVNNLVDDAGGGERPGTQEAA